MSSQKNRSAARMEILKIHAQSLAKHGDIDYEAIVKVCILGLKIVSAVRKSCRFCRFLPC